MDNLKKIKTNNRKFSKDEYSLYYPRSKKDSGFVTLFSTIALLLLLAGMITVIVLARDMSDEALIIAIIVSVAFATLVAVGLLIAYNNRPKHLNNGEALYSMYKDPKTFKIVENFSESSVAIKKNEVEAEELQEYDENGNPIYYAEELFDDEEDIFVNEVNSTLIAKEKARQYKEIIEHLDYTFKMYGLSGDLGRGLISAMSFSPMIYARPIRDYIPTVFEALKNPSFIIHYSDIDNIAHEKTLFKTFDYAKANPDVPVFVYIDNIPAREFMNFMRPLYAYIDNPNDDYYISSQGSTSYIPHNVFFLVDIPEGDYFYDIARRYLRYIGKLQVKIVPIDRSEEAEPYVLSNKELINARRNAMDEYALSETTFKKLDTLFATLRDANGYVLQNKIQRKIEEYSAILLSLGEEELSVVDDFLSNLIINAAIITSEPAILEEKCHFVRLIESEFGVDNMPKTKSIVKEYISLFASTKGGK